MCGRYVTPDESAIEREWSLKPREAVLFPVARYNVAPTTSVPIIRRMEGELELRKVRWGLVPFFAKGIANPKYTMHNSRKETIAEAVGGGKPGAYGGPWKRGQRCLIPALGFYEWHLDPVAGKHPQFIHDVEAPIFAFGGLYETSKAADGSVLESCTIITLPANDLMLHVHNTGDNPGRMPLIVPLEQREAWLTVGPAQAWEMLQPYPSGQMVAYRVSDAVNSAKNQGEDLLKPVAA